MTLPPAPSAGDTLEFVFQMAADDQDTAIAELEALGFSAFLQEDDTLSAYVPASHWGQPQHDALQRVMSTLPAALSATRAIPRQDWNAPWESSIEPILAGPFVVRPSWREPVNDPRRPIELVVDPKMSFGTGHHESTRLMLGLLPSCVNGGDYVLDAGTGTGILAIAAVKLGAATALAFDNDPWIDANARENIAVNGVSHCVEVRICSIEAVPEQGFDVILANINLHILLAYLPAFAARLRPGGRLAMAGMLVSDRDTMLAAAASHGFAMETEARENTWWAVVFALPEAA